MLVLSSEVTSITELKTNNYSPFHKISLIIRKSILKRDLIHPGRKSVIETRCSINDPLTCLHSSTETQFIALLARRNYEVYLKVSSVIK